MDSEFFHFGRGFLCKNVEMFKLDIWHDGCTRTDSFFKINKRDVDQRKKTFFQSLKAGFENWYIQDNHAHKYMSSFVYFAILNL